MTNIKSLLSFPIQGSLFCSLLSAPVHSADLTVQVPNLPATGSLTFLLFDSPNTFGDLRSPARLERKPVADGPDYRVEGMDAGEYALLVYLDENGNGQLDKNFIGIPKEPLGFSNGYEPKGPPSYSQAAFRLGDGPQHFDVRLRRPLGERGRIGVGLGAVGRSSPFREYDGNVSTVIPAITYAGDRLQILGPMLQFGIAGSGKSRVAVTGRFRMGVYDEADSSVLAGMGDRDSTFMGGLAWQAELPKGVDLSIGVETDVLDRIGGFEARLSANKSFQFGKFSFAPQLAMNWQSSELASYDYGVPLERATLQRSSFQLDDTVSVEAGLGVFYEITNDWLAIANISVEQLDDQVAASPIVGEDSVVKGFAAITYVF